jgi:DNA polymerase-1
MTGHGAAILKETMEKVGLPTDAESMTFTTAITCAVPKKKGANSFPSDAISNCRTRLVEEIRAIKPKMILVCGKVALQTLTGNTKLKITSEYGRLQKLDCCGDADVMPIMNPGLLLRSPGEYKPFLAMLQLAATIYNGGSQYDSGETHWEICDTQEKMYAAWKHLMTLHKEGKLPYASYDLETTSLDYREAEFLVLGICYEKNKTYVIPREMRKYAHNFLEGVPWKCVWQHGKYDKKVLWRRKLGTVNIGEDVMYMHYVLDETSAHDLEYLAKVFLQAEEYKYKMNQNWKAVTLDSYPQFFDALCERVSVDCDYTFQLVDVLMEKVKAEPKLRGLYEKLLIPAANFLTRVEQNGILVNPFFLQELDVKYVKLIQDILTEVQTLAAPFWDPELYMLNTGHKTAGKNPKVFNPGSPDQMAWMVFDRLKLRPRVKKGRSTAYDILASFDDIKDWDKTQVPEAKERLYQNMSPIMKIIAKVLEYRTVQKEHSTYVIGLLDARDEDGRVRTNFTLHVTATGRLSSKEPNVQNQPSANGVGNIRRAFIPKKGYVFGEIDYSSAELRWLAFLSKCPVLSDVFISNRNLHVETATELFGPHYTKQEKMRAKAVNFGIPYGREAQSFVDEFNITKEEASRMISGWLNKYHGAKDYLNWCAEQVMLGNYLETPFGRRRRFGLVSPDSLHALQNEARNFPIQSSSSDLLLVSSIEMEPVLYKDLNTSIINLIHDSDLLEIPADKKILMEVGKYCNTIMTQKPKQLFNCPIPFKTDFEIGTDWGNLVTFNYKSGMIELEEDDKIVEVDFDEWYAQNCHLDLYEKLGM